MTVDMFGAGSVRGEEQVRSRATSQRHSRLWSSNVSRERRRWRFGETRAKCFNCEIDSAYAELCRRGLSQKQFVGV